MNHRLVISAPFGNYLQWPGVVSTLGTYTLHRRAGFFRRWWRVLRTVRYSRGSWINKLGLPSPGVQSLPHGLSKDLIISIHGFDYQEWDSLLAAVSCRCPSNRIEINASCPNVASTEIRELGRVLRLAMSTFLYSPIVKLGPVRPLEIAKKLCDDLYPARPKSWHLCNTIPTARGGVSGKALKPFSLWAVEEFRKEFPSDRIIGGGGVTDLEDVKDFLRAGATDVSIGSMLFNPLNWRLVPQFRSFLTSLK